MRRISLLVLSIVAVCFTVVLASAANDNGPRYVYVLKPSCSYAIYTVDLGKKCCSWYDDSRRWPELTPGRFLQEWGIPFSNSTLEEIQFTLVFDAMVLNRVGSQGWHLIGNPMTEGKTVTYLFEK